MKSGGNNLNVLETKVVELLPQIKNKVTLSELYSDGYEPKHRTMRKEIGFLEICFRECGNNQYEFAALIRREDE